MPAVPPPVPPPSSGSPQFPQGSAPAKRGSFVGPPAPLAKTVDAAAREAVKTQLTHIQEGVENEAPVVRMYMPGEAGSEAPTAVHETVTSRPPLSSESRQAEGIKSKYPPSPTRHQSVAAEEERALGTPPQAGKLPEKVPRKEVPKQEKEVVNVSYKFAEAPVTQPQAPVKKSFWNWIKSFFSFRRTPKQQTPTPQAAPAPKIETEQEKQAAYRKHSINTIIKGGDAKQKAILYNILKKGDGKEADQYVWSKSVKKLATDADIIFDQTTIEELEAQILSNSAEIGRLKTISREGAEAQEGS